MKITCILLITIFLLSNCGKKSDPKYLGKHKQVNRIIS